MKHILRNMMLTTVLMSCMAVPAFAAQSGESAAVKQDETTVQTKIPSIMERLNGKKLELKYDSGDHYIVHYVDDEHIHWQAVGAPTDGGPAEETDKSVYHALGDDVYLVNWIENSGMTVSEVIDLKAGTVCAFLTWADDSVHTPSGRDMVVIKGTATIIP